MYVFGMDLPLMEILFVLFVLNFVALLLVWLEVRKMYSLLSVEKSDISHLESDVKLLDNFIHQNPSEMLLNYVTDKLEKGTPKNKIKTTLTKAGFDDEAISKIFKKFK